MQKRLISNVLCDSRRELASLALLAALASACQPTNPWSPFAKQKEGLETGRGDPEHSAGPKLECRDEGKLIMEVPIRHLGRRATSDQVVVFEPTEKAQVPFEGVRMEQFLDNLYGRRWRQATSLRLQMEGGQSALVAVADLIRFRSWLTWRRMDRPEFTAERHEDGVPMPLEPLYLVWDSLGEPSLKARGSWGWLARVVAIDLTSVMGDVGAIKPPASAPEEVRAGFEVFSQACIACHTVGGHGSFAGPELNSPISITVIMREEWLAKYIDDPRKVRARATMPPLPAETPQRDRVIANVISYLKYEAAHPPAPLPASPTPASKADEKAAGSAESVPE